MGIFYSAKLATLLWDLFDENGTPFNVPRRSDWRITGAGGTTGSVDIADIATLGATTLIPLNATGSIGTTEIALRHQTARLSVTVEGVGAGGGVGVGWSLPATITYAGGELGLEGFSLGQGMELPSSGIGSLVAGPKAHEKVISPHELVAPLAEPGGTPCLTVASVAAGTGGQYALAIVFFADRPVTESVDLAYVKAVGFTMGFELSIGSAAGAGVSYMVYKLNLRESSLPFPGARFGASVAAG